MNKFKKLLSVLLAAVMLVSCFSILGSAYPDTKTDIDESSFYYYDSNDNPRVYLYSDEQRATIVMNTLDKLLASLNINTTVNILVTKLNVDLRSFDALGETLTQGILTTALGMETVAGDLSSLVYEDLEGAKRSDGDVVAINKLLATLSKNEQLVVDILTDGIDLGIVESAGGLDFTSINEMLADLPGLIGGLLYGLDDRYLTNGIGEDTALKNDTPWDDLAVADRPTIDAMLPELISNLLTNPRNTTPITDPSQNTLGQAAAEAGLVEVQPDGTNRYYCYGVTNNADGTQTLITSGNEADKQYLTHWDVNSALLKGEAAADFKKLFSLDKDLYTLLEDMLGWAYDNFAGHNLDAQLRATLMQFCGAFNNGDTVDDATKAQLKEIMDGYKALETAANLDKEVLQKKFLEEEGRAGNYNFMYISLSGANINTKPDDLYYVVEWGGSYQYYHVEFNDLSKFFDLIDWEYQAPTWAELTTAIGWTEGTSLLQYINKIVGEILTTAVNRTAEADVTYWTDANKTDTTTATESLSLEWNYSTADGALAGNVVNLIKLILKADTRKLFGSTYHLPYNFNTLTLEGQLVELAKLLTPKLVKALVLPEDVASVEEVIAYAVREFIAEILPETTGWDAALDAATTDDDFLDIALSMGTSIGIYYLTNLIGLGTEFVSEGNSSVSNWMGNLDYGTKTWQQKLDYIVDWVVTTYVADLTKTAGFTESGEDGLNSLSKILSALAPSLLKVLGMGSEDGSLALDLNVVYDHLRNVLNGDFSGICKALFRKASGTSANVKAIQAIGTLITELFGGLGLSHASQYTELVGKFTTAYASATPIQALIGNYNTIANIASLAGLLVAALGETGQTYWAYDVIAIVLMLFGSEKGLTNNGLQINGIKEAYMGSASQTIDYSFMMSTSGIREYFNDGNYKTGTGYMDGDYALKVLSATVYRGDGTKAATDVYTSNNEFAPNQEVHKTVYFENIPSDPEVYTLEIEYQIKAPTASNFEGAETLKSSYSFVVTSAANDEYAEMSYNTVTYSQQSSASSHLHSDDDGSGSDAKEVDIATGIQQSWKVGWTNAYISEVEALSKVQNAVVSLTDLSYDIIFFTKNEANKNIADYQNLVTGKASGHTYAQMWIDQYGENQVDDNGDYVATSFKDGSVVITKDGTSVTYADSWFKWNGNQAATNSPGAVASGHTFGTVTNARAEGQMWGFGNTASRSDFEADFTSYAVTAKLSAKTNYTTSSFASADLGSDYDAIDVLTIKPYVTLYNSYNLKEITASSIGKKAENYPEAGTAWTEYQNAVKYANQQLYVGWNASTFAKDHTLNVADITVPVDPSTGSAFEGYEGATVSSFKYAADRLVAAVDALNEFYKETDEADASATIIDPSDSTSPYHAMYNAVKAEQLAFQNGKADDNYTPYTWWRYYDEYSILNSAVEALTVPTEAQDTLVGVWGDNAQIDRVIAAIAAENTGVAGIVEGMVEEPTTEAVQAATDAYNAFADAYADVVSRNDPAIHAARINMMQIYGRDNAEVPGTNQGRLLAKYSEQKLYYLNDAITNYGNEVASDYSEGSFAEYTARLNEAKAVAADSASTQYEIFSARYELLVAYKALVKAGEEINVTTNGETEAEEDGLKALYAQANELLAGMSQAAIKDVDGDGDIDADDTTAAYEQLVRTAGYAVDAVNDRGLTETYYIGGEYTAAYALSQEGKLLSIKKQAWVDEITVRLADAIANFITDYIAPILSGIVNTTGFVDATNKYVYGIDIGGAIADFFNVANGTYTITATENGVEAATGSILNVVDSKNEVVDTYTVVIFGDVNGDGQVTVADSIVVEMGSVGTSIDGEAYNMAADVNGDGQITVADSIVVEMGSVGTPITVNPYAE